MNTVNPNTVSRFVGGTPLTVNYWYEGTKDIPAGDVVVVAKRPLIARTGIKARPADGYNAGLDVIGGWYEMKCTATGVKVTANMEMYWDDTNKVVTPKASGNYHLGFTLSDQPEIASGATGVAYIYHCPNGTVGS